jgi:outer membrane protein TolC
MGTIFETVRTYFGALVAEEALQVIGSAIEATGADLQRAEALLEAGMATQADVLSLRVHRAALESEQISAANQLRILRAGLNRIMSEPLDSEHSLTTPLEPLKGFEPAQLETLENRALNLRPEVRQSQLRLEQAQIARKRARSSFLPSVALEAGWESNRESFLGSGGTNWMVGVALEFNIFNGLADRARLGAAEAGELMSDALRVGAEDAVRLDVRSAFLDLRAAKERVEVTGKAVEQAEESHRIIESRYEAGLANVTELLRSQNAVLDAEARNLKALYEQRVATVRLDMATGTLNPESGALKP